MSQDAATGCLRPCLRRLHAACRSRASLSCAVRARSRSAFRLHRPANLNSLRGALTGIQGREPHRTEAGFAPGTAVRCARRCRVAHPAAGDGFAFGSRHRGRPRGAGGAQDAQGYWLFELEADCTIPAEYIMMMHFLDEIDAALETKLCRYLRRRAGRTRRLAALSGRRFQYHCSVRPTMH